MNEITHKMISIQYIKNTAKKYNAGLGIMYLTISTFQIFKYYSEKYSI